MIKLIGKPFAAVAWNDAHCISGATEMAEHEIPHAPAIYTAYGFILRQDEVGITLANEVSGENTYRSINFIPAGMIVEVQVLSVAKQKVKKITSVPQKDTPEH